MITIDYGTRAHSTTAPLVDLDGNAVTREALGKATTHALVDPPKNVRPQLNPNVRETAPINLTLTGRHSARNSPPEIDRVQVSAPEGSNQPAHQPSIDDQSRDFDNVEESILEDYHAEFWLHQRGAAGDQNKGGRFALPAIANLHRHTIRQIEMWRKRPITKLFRYVFLAEIELNCDRGCAKLRVPILTAVGVDEDGVREVLGVAEGAANSATSWLNFFEQLKRQGLFGIFLFIGQRRKRLAKHLSVLFPGAKYQNNFPQFRDEILSKIPIDHQLQLAKKIGRIFTSTDCLTASRLIADMTAELRRLELISAAGLFEKHVRDCLNYLVFPSQHRHLLKSNCAQLALLRSIGERAKVTKAFSDGPSAVHLVSARLRYIESNAWKKKCYAQGCR